MWSEEWKKETNWFVIKLLLLKLKGLSISNISMLLTLLSSRWPCVRTDWRRKWVGRNQHRTLVQCPCKALQRVQLQGTLDIFVPLNSSPGPNRGDLYVKIKNRRMFSSEVKSFDCWYIVDCWIILREKVCHEFQVFQSEYVEWFEIKEEEGMMKIYEKRNRKCGGVPEIW